MENTESVLTPGSSHCRPVSMDHGTLQQELRNASACALSAHKIAYMLQGQLLAAELSYPPSRRHFGRAI